MLLCIPILPLHGLFHGRQTWHSPSLAAEKSALSISRGGRSPEVVVSFSSDGERIALPCSLQLPPHLFQAKPAPGFPILSGRLCFPCRLGQGLLEALKSSHKLAAGEEGFLCPATVAARPPSALLPTALPSSGTVVVVPVQLSA